MALIRARRVALGSINVSLMAYSALVAVVILYHHPVRLDLSAERMNALSDDTLTCLASLDRPVEVILSFGELDARKMRAIGRIFARAQAVLREMSLASDKIAILDIIDVNQRGEAWDRLKARYGLAEHNRVTMLCGGRRQDIRLEDMADLTWGPNGISQIRSFRVERSLAAALRRLLGSPRKVCFLRNDGTEGRVGATIGDTSPRGFRELGVELAANNYELEELDLVRVGKVPGDCDVLLAAGLIGPLPEEVPPIVAYLKSGGKLFLALNPLVEPSQLGFLQEWGFVIEPAWTVMQIPIAGTAVQTENVIATVFNPLHPITRKFEKDRFRMSMIYARPIDSARGKYGERESIVTAEGSAIWGERRIDDRPWARDPNDFAAPLSLAGVSEASVHPHKPTRIAIFGSASFLTNRDLRSYDHLSVVHNTLWWLLGQEELASVQGPEDVVRNLNFDPEGRLRRMLSWALLAIVPGCAVIAGLAVFLIRRR